MDFVVWIRRCRVTPDQIPPPEDREAWLDDYWALIDSWITERLADVD